MPTYFLMFRAFVPYPHSQPYTDAIYICEFMLNSRILGLHIIITVFNYLYENK